MTRKILSPLAVCLLVVAIAPQAAAFSVFGEIGVTVPAVMAWTPRWSAEPDPFGLGTGLHDGIQVGVDAGFGAAIGVPEIALLYGMSEAFVTFDATLPGSFEMTIAAEPFPAGSEKFFGRAFVYYQLASDRLLTNGQRFDGLVITDARIQINSTRISEGIWFLHAIGTSLAGAQNGAPRRAARSNRERVPSAGRMQGPGAARRVHALSREDGPTAARANSAQPGQQCGSLHRDRGVYWCVLGERPITGFRSNLRRTRGKASRVGRLVNVVA
ncbi:MAG: hypothetical protein QNK03_00935 [Myxococcota bacterium]|nr:hypothetical protein [Myxococcota bacterium]